MKPKKSGCGIGTLLIILSIVMLVAWFFYSINNSTLYDFEYKQARELKSAKLISYDGSSMGLCDYPECTQEAEERIYLDPVYPHIMPKGIKLMMNMPNEAGFQMCSDSFTYTERNEHTVYDTKTYLIPQGDGKIRVETKTDTYVVHTDGASKTVNYVSFEGHYCSDHSGIAYRTWLAEAEDAFISKNIGYYFYEYGLWASILLTPVCFVIFFVLTTIIVLIRQQWRKLRHRNNADN